MTFALRAIALFKEKMKGLLVIALSLINMPRWEVLIWPFPLSFYPFTLRSDHVWRVVPYLTLTHHLSLSSDLRSFSLSLTFIPLLYFLCFVPIFATRYLSESEIARKKRECPPLLYFIWTSFLFMVWGGDCISWTFCPHSLYRIKLFEPYRVIKSEEKTMEKLK